MKFKESSVSQRIYDFYDGKYGMGGIGLIKTTAVASLRVKNKEILPLSVLDVSPSGNFKSRSSIELGMIFPEEYVEFLGSDITMHGLINAYKGGKNIDGKCCVINDLALTLESKDTRTQKRLMSGAAELLSEGKYEYKEREGSESMEARIGLIANVTREKYLENPSLFQKNTLAERFLVIHHDVDIDQQKAFLKERKQRFKMTIGDKIVIQEREINITEKDMEEIVRIAEKWRLFAMSPSLSRVGDKICSLLAGHANLNGRDYIHEDDWVFLEMIQPLLIEPTIGKKDVEILTLYNKGKKIEEIREITGYKEKKSVYNVLNKYRRRGVIT